MSQDSHSNDAPGAGRYGPFSLDSVCWGYRQVFAQVIEGMLEQGLIGPERREVSAKFFDLLAHADRGCFDHVLKEFLGAINPRTGWMMALPDLFADVVDLGRELAESKLHHGIAYFATLGRGGFGDTPGQVRELIKHMRALRRKDDELAVALMKGYRKLIERLSPAELAQYVQVGLEVFHRSAANGKAFMEGTLVTAETYVLSLTKECRIEDVRAVLTALLQALTGREIEVGDLGSLDSDNLAERGTSVVCTYHQLFLPARIRHFDSRRLNRDWYMLTGVVSAAMLAADSFCAVHGRVGHSTCKGLVGDDPARLNLLQIVEYVRVLEWIRRRWPGAAGLVDFGLETERTQRPPTNAADRLFFDAAMRTGAEGARESVVRLARDSADVFDTARKLRGGAGRRILDQCAGLATSRLRAFAFLPDFLFPGGADSPPAEGLIASLGDAAGKQPRRDPDAPPAEAPPRPPSAGDSADPTDKPRGEPAVGARYVYDEWSHEENDYYRDHCFVHERVGQTLGKPDMPEGLSEAARNVSRVFERLKPDLARREKHLPDGDAINHDLLLEYLVQRRREPTPRVDFYERPIVSRRDLAVLILLDVSGSAGETIGGLKTVIDVEKQAAVILGQGLASLGDRFSICGFSSNGRQNCAYFVYKDFPEPWSGRTVGRVLSAVPSSSTRMGAALRHSAHRLGAVNARRRLVLIITDGKPMDSGYDPKTRYAQHDVRMACTEADRRGIHTFAISTEPNSQADMETMFPRRRFAMLNDVADLPRVLPGLYTRLTM